MKYRRTWSQGTCTLRTIGPTLTKFEQKKKIHRKANYLRFACSIVSRSWSSSSTFQRKCWLISVPAFIFHIGGPNQIDQINRRSNENKKREEIRNWENCLPYLVSFGSQNSTDEKTRAQEFIYAYVVGCETFSMIIFFFGFFFSTELHPIHFVFLIITRMR